LTTSPVKNFSFLQDTLPDLAQIASLAEEYTYTDPDSSVAKLRMFTEKLLRHLAPILNVDISGLRNLGDLLIESDLRKSLPKPIINKLHLLRKLGNKGVHTGGVSEQEAIEGLQDAQDVSGWIYISYFGGKGKDIPSFNQPQTPKAIKEDLQRYKNELAEKDAYIEELLAEQQFLAAEPSVSYDSGTNQKALIKRGEETAKQLGFSEAETRDRLIDWELRNAGWDVGAKGVSTEEVKQEVDVKDQPTPSGSGRADYVLFGDDAKPLAVIEAKKPNSSSKSGKKQAELYANALEEEYGQRPIIFYTNGFETHIWNDRANEPPRQIFGFYSKDSLEYLIFQRDTRQTLKNLEVNPDIAGRMYQIRAIKQVAEKFDSKRRKALIVMATGTGKTRVAIALAEALMNRNWVKRILFLCDRKELRKQAKNAFQEYTKASITVVNRKTAKDRNKRIYMATYPAMKRVMGSFDVGFFDLIIADESHRSIYNTYRDIFLYFDALQVGLTATPVNFIHRNTFNLFDCKNENGEISPTAYFSYKDALDSSPPYLLPFEVIEHTTEFQREGIKYSQMTDEQKAELEEELTDPELAEYDSKHLDSKIFNKDTNREILRNLMEKGIRDAKGGLPGKSIIFARNHNHAELLEDLFNEMYPQYGSKFCEVIDNYNPRAEALIDDFKGRGTNPDLNVAISVDMLDTGIDVPEVVNLVFAKPVKSYVKFWQMIGRGTRLCPNLFGLGKDKEKFLIFDHWGNFRWFEENYTPADPGRSKSLLEQLFLERIRLAETARNVPETKMFEKALDLIASDVNDLKATDTIAVKENWRDILIAAEDGVIQRFSTPTVQLLQNKIAPLMVWRSAFGKSAFYNFDKLIAQMQIALLQKSSTFEDLKGNLQNWLGRLLLNMEMVRDHLLLIEELKKEETWKGMTPSELERIRTTLRKIMDKTSHESSDYEALVVDVHEVREEIQTSAYKPKLPEMEMAGYRKRVENVLQELFESNSTLQKIRAAQPVSEDDVEELVKLVLVHDANIDLALLKEFYSQTENLQLLIRKVIGLDREYVEGQFAKFVQSNPELEARQIRFLELLQNHIVKNGGIEKETLYESPFTMIDSAGIAGVFEEDTLVDELFEIIDAINELPAS